MIKLSKEPQRLICLKRRRTNHHYIGVHYILNQFNQPAPRVASEVVLRLWFLLVPSVCLSRFYSLDFSYNIATLLFNCYRCWQIYNRRSNHYYGYVWVYVGMYWYVWVWMGMYGYVWVCMDIYWYVWVYMGMCSSKCYYSLLYRTVLYCTVTLVCKYAGISVCQYLSM